VVDYRDGAPVMLAAVARVIDSVENDKLAAWLDQTPAVIVNIQRQPGANTIQVVDSIIKLLPRLQTALPRSVHVHIVTDRTTAVRASIRDVEFELLMAVGLVVLVIFVFLRSIPATIIPAVTVPLSLIGTFGVMYLAGFSLNNLVMMAMTISAGFLVDDAIVMIENINRFIEQGEKPLEAALKGADQIGFTIISLTVSLIAVLIPLLFMGDVAGRLFRQFAVTLAVTILLSAFISLTLTPMMAARLLRKIPEEGQNRLYRASERVFKAIVAFYGRTLKAVIRHQVLTVLVAVATVALTVLLYVVIPKGFFPTQDTGIIQGISQAGPATSFPAMALGQQALVKVLLADPAVESVSSFIGADGTNTTLNSGRIQINLKPLAIRRLSSSAVIARLGPKLSEVPGIRLYMQPVQDLTVDDQVSRTEYQYTLEDPSQAELDRVVHGLTGRLTQLPQFEDVVTDQQLGGLAAALTIDRATAARFGITPVTIDNTLYDAFGQRQINTLYTQLNQYHVILEVDPRLQRNPQKLQELYIQSSSSSGDSAATGQSSAGSSSGAGAGTSQDAGNVLMSASATSGVGTVSAVPALTPIATGQGTSAASASSAMSPSYTRSGDGSVLTALSTTGGVGSGDDTATAGTSRPAAGGGASAASGGGAASRGGAAMAVATPVPLSAFTTLRMSNEMLSINHQGQFPATTISFNLARGYSLGQALTTFNGAIAQEHLPPSVIAGYQGAAAAFESSISNEGLLVLAALVTVYIVLGILYESYIHPITILSTLPSAGVGALLALMLFGMDLDIVAIIGIILLIGIVQKNGIMMVDFALELQRRQHKSAQDAIYEASLLRFRPILMTTLAALLSGLPLAFGTGIGSELRKPLGVAIIGGLLFSQVLTLYTTPVIYIVFDALSQRISGRTAQPDQVAGHGPPAPAPVAP